LKNFTKCIAMNYWWCWNIPLWDKLSVWYVYDDKYDVYDEFIKYLVWLFGEIDESKIVKLKIKTWRNKKHIINNVIAIWLSSCFIEPLESTWLYFVVKNIDSLWKYLHWDLNEDKFNEIINNEFDDVINFILAHYKYTKNKNEYWSYYKNIPISIYKNPHLFNKNSWYMILKWMWRTDLIKSYLWENVYKSYTVIENIFDYSKYSNDKISYIDWINTVDYSNWKNDKNT
jgi:hypothetical protein